MVEIVTYETKYRADFIRLNRQWIERYFRLETADLATFAHVDDIVNEGGQIFIARTEEDKVVGCCALKHHTKEARYELSKMAVDPAYQGQHIGWQLGKALTDYARVHGVREIYLEGNTRMEASIALYRKLGFREIPFVSDEDNAYERCNIFMIWREGK